LTRFPILRESLACIWKPLSAGAIKQIMKLFGESGWQGRQGRTRMPLSALRRLLFVPTPLVWRSYVHELVYEQWTRVARRSGRSDTSIGILNYAQFVDALQLCSNHALFMIRDLDFLADIIFITRIFSKFLTDFLAEFFLLASLKLCSKHLVWFNYLTSAIDSSILDDKLNCLLMKTLFSM
jgi:hypothetical protein